MAYKNDQWISSFEDQPRSSATSDWADSGHHEPECMARARYEGRRPDHGSAGVVQVTGSTKAGEGAEEVAARPARLARRQTPIWFPRPEGTGTVRTLVRGNLIESMRIRHRPTADVEPVDLAATELPFDRSCMNSSDSITK